MRSASRSARSLFAVLFLLLFVLSVSLAAISFKPVNPDELKMKSEPAAPGASAVILFRQVDRDDNGRTSHEDSYIRIKILTEEGRKQANVEIPYESDLENIVNVHARSVRPDGAIANFDGKVFKRNIVKGHGVSYWAMTLTVPDVQVGSIIEYYYTDDLQEDMLFNSNWVISQDLFTKHAEFSLKPYSGEGWGLTWVWQGLPPGVQPNKVGANNQIRLSVDNIPAFIEEDYMPPRGELESRVDFLYRRSGTETEPDKYWKQFGKDKNSQLEDFVNKRSAMAQAVAQIVSPGDSDEVKLHKIYDRVQKMRNLSTEHEKTDEERKREKEKALNNVEDVWKQGYGNGGQLTWLFLGLARAAGFEAHGCWVADRYRYFFNPKLMQGNRLDSNVALVMLNGKELYFDPGAPFSPYGLLLWPETGTTGLKLDKNGGTWIQTPLPAAAQSTIERTANLELTAGGSLEGKLTVKFTGLEAMERRRAEQRADAVARKKYLEDEVKSQVSMGIELELTNSPDWTGSSAPLIGEFSLKVPGWAQGSGKRVILPGALFTQTEKHVFDNATRHNAIYFEYPSLKSDDIALSLPPGWTVISKPEPILDDGAHQAGYENRITVEDGKLRLQRKLRVDFSLIEQKYYSALRQFFSRVKNADEGSVLLQPGSVQLIGN